MFLRAASVAIVQARMSSSRLPGKTLADVGGEPMLTLLLGRLSAAQSVAEIVVATSVERVDDPVAALASDLGVGVIRGPRDDVLARYLLAIEGRNQPVVRITGDCPLIDPRLVDATMTLFRDTRGCAYASNLEPRTFPDGLDVEVVDPDALRAVAADDLSALEREHVTVAVRAHPERFAAVSLTGSDDLGSLRWTVDQAEDLEFVRTVVERLGERRYGAGLNEILGEVRRSPSLADFGGTRRG